MSHKPCPDCSSSDACKNYVTHTYCFSCKTRKWLHSQPREFVSYFPEFEEGHMDREVSLPISTSYDFSKAAKEILLKAGLHSALSCKYNIGFVHYERVPYRKDKVVEFKNRIIIPMYNRETNTLECYQARDTMGEKMKYLTVGTNTLQELFRPSDDIAKPNKIVIVEDMFSAIRVFEAGYNALPLLGTSLPKEKALQLVQKYDTIIIWLDDDSPGQNASLKIENKLKLYAKDVKVVKNCKEPKLCFDQDIHLALGTITG